MFDMAAVCGTKDSSSSALFATGAALFDKYPSKLRMDISGVSTNIRINSEIQKLVYSIGAVITIILILMILNGQRKISSVNSELQGYIQQNSNSDLTGANPDEIRGKIDVMKQQAGTLATIFNSNDYLAPKLSVLVDIIPKQLWLESITYSNPMTVGNQEGGRVQFFSIYGGTYLTGEPRSQVIEGFLKELKKNENEFKEYLPPRGNLNLTVTGAMKNSRNADDGGISRFTIDSKVGGRF
jgi:hypothetical protein